MVSCDLSAWITAAADLVTLLAGTADFLVPFHVTQAFVELLRSHNVRYELLKFEGLGVSGLILGYMSTPADRVSPCSTCSTWHGTLAQQNTHTSNLSSTPSIFDLICSLMSWLPLHSCYTVIPSLYTFLKSYSWHEASERRKVIIISHVGKGWPATEARLRASEGVEQGDW